MYVDVVAFVSHGRPYESSSSLFFSLVVDTNFGTLLSSHTTLGDGRLLI